MTRVAVVTPVRGRHRHLTEQHRSLVQGTRRPDSVVVVAMGDETVPDVVASGPLGVAVADVQVVPLPVGADGRLPLAAARNAGAAAALAHGADLLLFLDVDCLAGRHLVAGYVDASSPASPIANRGARLLAGPVAYLPPLPPGVASYDAEVLATTPPHPGRPAPPGGTLQRGDPRLFWSLSFAVTAQDWRRLSGFDEGYTGYGGEDTDFAQAAVRDGATLWWVGGALAHHQWHPVSDPPVEHLEDIVVNANRFHTRWGWFPMQGWLNAFAERGLARQATPGGRWQAGGHAKEPPQDWSESGSDPANA